MHSVDYTQYYYKVVDYDLTAFNTNIAPLSFNANNISLQVGIDSNSSSSISFSDSLELNSIGVLRNLGKSNLDFISIIDKGLNFVSEKQTEFGAVQNRLESALDEISIKYENLVSSRSTIRDADIADESSNYIQAQILQQAAATLMATANQSPSIALQLI